MFSELVGHAARVEDEGGAGSDGGRSRMEDELQIFLRKYLSSATGNQRRIGIIGTVTLVKHLAAATSDGAETQGAIGEWWPWAADCAPTGSDGSACGVCLVAKSAACLPP